MNKKISCMILCAWMLNTSSVSAAENNFRCEPIGNFTQEFLGKFKIGSYTIDPTQSGAFIAMIAIPIPITSSKEEKIKRGMWSYLTKCGMLNNSDFQTDSLDDYLAKLAKLTNRKIIFIEVGAGRFVKPDFFSSAKLAIPSNKRVLEFKSNLISDQSVQSVLQVKSLIEVFKSGEGIFFLYHGGMDKLFKCEGISREQYSENRAAWDSSLLSNDADGKNLAQWGDNIRSWTSVGKKVIKDIAINSVAKKILPSESFSSKNPILSAAVSAAKGFAKNQLPDKLLRIIEEENVKRREENIDVFLQKRSSGEKFQKNHKKSQKSEYLKEEGDYQNIVLEIDNLYRFNSKLMDEFEKKGLMLKELVKSKNLKSLANYINNIIKIRDKKIQDRLTEIENLKQEEKYQSAFKKYDQWMKIQEGLPPLGELINLRSLDAIDNYINSIKEVKKMQALFQYFIDRISLENLNVWLKENGFPSFEELEDKNDLTTLINACNAIENSLRSKDGWGDEDFEIVYSYK
jgi:hypothetical protein